MSAPPWLTKESVAEFAKLKMDHPDGLDVFTAMAVAAHKQWEDVEFLIGIAEAIEEDQRVRLERISNRHELYREAKEGRPDVVFP